MLLCWPVGTHAAQQNIDQIFLLLKSLYLGALRMWRKEKSSRLYWFWESTKASTEQNDQASQRSGALKWIMRRAPRHVTSDISGVIWVPCYVHSFWLLAVSSDPTELCHLLPGFSYHCHFTILGKQISRLSQCSNSYWPNHSSSAETGSMGFMSVAMSHQNLKEG